MKLKRVFFPLFSLFLIYDAQRWFFTLLSIEPQQVSTGSSVFFALILTIDLLGWIATPGLVFPFYRIVPQQLYHTPHLFRNDVNHLYRFLGVEYFRKLVFFLFWKRGSNRRSFFNGTKSGLSELLQSSQRAEFGHWVGLILVNFVATIMLIDGYRNVALFALLFNFFLNLYPILLQRYHRIRVEKMLYRIH